MFLQHSKFISVLDFCSWWSLCLKGSVFLFYTSCCFSLFKCHFFWDGGFSLTTVKPIRSVSYLIILWYDSSEPFSIYIILFYLIVYCFITQSRMQDFWEPRPCMVCSTPRPCMACSKYLKPWLAHSSALNNFQRYDSSFLSFIGDKSKAQGGVRAEILTQCCALKTYTAMPPFAQLKVGNIKWRKGNSEFSEFPLSPWAGSYCFYRIVSEELVLITLYSSILGLFSLPFSFRLRAQDTHD